MEEDQATNDSNDALLNEVQEGSIGKLKETANKKECSKPLNTIVEERHKGAEARGSDSQDEQGSFGDDDDNDDDDILIATHQDKASFTVKANIPKIMISKDRIAV